MLQVRVAELQEENAKLKARVASLAGDTWDEPGARRQRRRVGPGPYDAAPSDAAVRARCFFRLADVAGFLSGHAARRALHAVQLRVSVSPALQHCGGAVPLFSHSPSRQLLVRRQL